jgi:beta-lactamase class A/predicted secreted protein
MQRMIWLTAALLVLPFSTPSQAAPKKPKPASAPSAPLPATPLDLRIEQLVPLIKGQIALDQYFSPTFLAAVPPAQFKSVSDSVRTQYGEPQKVVSVNRGRPNGATVKLAFEKAVATVEIDVEAGVPGKVVGLFLSGFEVSGDSVEAIGAEFKALPGSSGFLLAELSDDGGARVVAAQNPEKQFAIGSTFKLYILAELASQIKSGERKWSDVVPLTHHSFSSAATQGWPKDSPVTLYTLAGWMIAVSDNGATDTLLNLLGREAVERKLASIGHGAPDKTLPFLSTVEAFALKANPALRDRFLKASEAKQRELIESEKASLSLEKINSSAIGGAPASIDSIEWFASPADILTLMRSLRLQRDDRMMAIMGINGGLPAATAKKWRYVGYKGGSEPGVISMSYLLNAPNGKWYVATGSWNDTAKEVDKGKFSSLMQRLVQQATN